MRSRTIIKFRVIDDICPVTIHHCGIMPLRNFALWHMFPLVIRHQTHSSCVNLRNIRCIISYKIGLKFFKNSAGSFGIDIWSIRIFGAEDSHGITAVRCIKSI